MFFLNIKRSSLLAMSVLMIGCGGGGGGGGSAAGSDSNATDTNTDSAIPLITIANNSGAAESTQTAIEMQDLVASPKFLFTSKQAVQVSVSLSEYQLQRAYISVYGDYQQLPSGRFYPDSSSRTVAGDLQQGQFDNTFVSLTNQSTYLVEVWLYDGQDALQKELTLSDNKLLW
ncbi:hypothetical protein [Psychromonas sp. Urea-02u-13]|uniref:hypothetical protein n=1 Tax=Psychromonas sp. Urea-02u-13 TaxID=2058326 RepID=UPI000C32C5A7|nr:hypothetical protein [Psychromonas sp. Urea-02u-13]PKG37903.1 hypothetical protein CXF74_16320 [Psychromonas sp. Urea-02u-13]